MDRKQILITVSLGIFAFLILILKIVDVPVFGYFMSVFTLIIIGVVIQTLKKGGGRPVRLSLTAFFFMLIGDIFLNFTPHATLHIASFAVSLLLLTSSFIAYKPEIGSLPPLGITTLLSAVLYGVIVIPVLPHELALHFLIYVILLTLMVWRAFLLIRKGSDGRVLFTGAVLFYFADILVGIRILFQPELINIPIYIMYPAAMILLAIAPWFRRDE